MGKARLFITTDMQMMTGVNHIAGDKDDVQSLVHALLFQDRIEIVGLASSTSRHQPGANDDSFIHRVIGAYEKDQAALKTLDGGFKSADALRQITHQGTKSLAGPAGYGAPTDASRAIIAEAEAAAAAGELLYVAAWGGLGDVARALHDAPQIASGLRLLSASGPAQEPNAYKFIKENFAGRGELWWIDAQTTQLGVYAGPAGKTTGLNNDWSTANARGHGALGDLFHDNTIDVKGRLDDFDAVKMGDSFSTFFLIDPYPDDDPTATGWGGRYQAAGPGYFVDRPDLGLGWSGSAGAQTTFEHRDAWQADLAHRFDVLRGRPAPPPMDEALAGTFWRVTGISATSPKSQTRDPGAGAASEAAARFVQASDMHAKGLTSAAQHLDVLVDLTAATSSVAVQTYRVLAHATPTPQGLAWIVDSAENKADLTDPYYAAFNLANRYLNLSVSLALEGPASAQFAADYGALSFSAAAAQAYERVIGRQEAREAGLDPEAAIQWLVSQRDYFIAVGGSDLGAKAALVGQVIHSGSAAGVGREHQAFKAWIEMAAAPQGGAWAEGLF